MLSMSRSSVFICSGEAGEVPSQLYGHFKRNSICQYGLFLTLAHHVQICLHRKLHAALISSFESRVAINQTLSISLEKLEQECQLQRLQTGNPQMREAEPEMQNPFPVLLP